jgi:hypothetical protein
MPGTDNTVVEIMHRAKTCKLKEAVFIEQSFFEVNIPMRFLRSGTGTAHASRRGSRKLLQRPMVSGTFENRRVSKEKSKESDLVETQKDH